MRKYSCPGWRCPSCDSVVTLTEKDEAPHYDYKCPACGAVTGADEWYEENDRPGVFNGMKGAEPKKIIERFAEIQRGRGSRLCPRCGEAAMDEKPTRNALSRHADVYVCDRCGVDEAVRDFAKIPVDLSSWAIVRIVNGK